MAKRFGLQEPHLQPDGSMPYVPLPDHYDPDFVELTYGDPFGRLNKLNPNDFALFIESGTVSPTDWGYFIVAALATEAVYVKKHGLWAPEPSGEHLRRILLNAHERRGDTEYAILLGDAICSKMRLVNPVRISKAQDPRLEVKSALNLPSNMLRGYWFKKWFGHKETENLLGLIERYNVHCIASDR